MVILLSPAKTFTNDYKKGLKDPLFINKTMPLVNILKNYSVNELETSLKISNKLANDVYKYYQNFSLNYAAVYLYGGQAYKYLKANEISKDNLKNLYILSPLYGLINALDNISLYRLDIKDKIIDTSLYTYWYDEINNKLKKIDDKLIINLSSGEFSRLLDFNNRNITTINFGVIKDNKLIQQSMLIKKMRGMMANYLLVNNINSIDEIININIHGFTYNKKYSDDYNLMFTK